MLTSCMHDGDESDGDVAVVGVGDQVPDFRLTGSDGSRISSASLGGQVYVLNFFDTSCPDCQQELQVLQRIYGQYDGAVTVVNVPRSETEAEVRAYWSQAGLSMPFFIASDKDLYYQFAKRTIPRTYVVDGDGKVLAAFADSPIADYETLHALLQQHLSDNGNNTVQLSLRLKVPKSNGDDDPYFFNEYIISRLEAWFFDAETKKFFTKFVVTGFNKDDMQHDARYDISYLFENFRLSVGVYDIFVIANYEHSPEVVENEAELLNMIDDLTYAEGLEANIPDKGPVMTNRATSLLGVDLSPWANKAYFLSVELERVMAKLRIGVSQNSFVLEHDGEKYAEVNLTNYKLVNMNRCYYLFQHTDSLTELGAQPEFELPKNFTEHDKGGDWYVIDPHFYQKTPDKAGVTPLARYYNSWFGGYNTDNFASMPSANNFGYAYILENTVFKSSQKNGFTAGIVFKGAVNPVHVLLYDEDSRALKIEKRPEYWPNTIYLYKYQFYESIRAVNVDSGLMLDELETYNDEQLKRYGIKQIKFNMGVYETYYTYWLRHRNSKEEPMGPMQYGVVRNNYYSVIVSGVSGIGNSVITPEVLRDNYPNSYVDIE